MVLGEKDVKNGWLVLKAGLLVLVAMSAYETVKQSVWPNISLWESHLVTIAFSTVCSAFAAYWVTARLQRMMKELVVRSIENERLRKDVEDALIHLQETTKTVDTLTSLLPMCAWCKSIRDDDGNWHSIEAYMTGKTQTVLTHGICPRCADSFEKRDCGGP